MTRVARVLSVAAVSLAGVGVAVVVPAAPAQACSCVGWSPAEAVEAADVVFVGSLEARRRSFLDSLSPTRSSGDPVTLTFGVDRVYKGSVLFRQDVATLSDGTSCGWELPGSGPFIVLASYSEGFPGADSTDLVTGLCSGSQPLDTPEARQALAALGSGVRPARAPSDPPGAAWGWLAGGAVLGLGIGAAVLGWVRRRLLPGSLSPTP